MKTLKRTFLGALIGLSLSTSASAVMITGGAFDGTDVGAVDIKKNEVDNMKSGAQTEVNWVNNFLGTSFTKSDYSKESDVSWFKTDVIAVYAFKLVGGPGYYLIKNKNTHVLYENIGDINWGVINLDFISGNINLGSDMTISHVGGFGTKVSVPAPATLALLGLGLLAGGLARRKQV